MQAIDLPLWYPVEAKGASMPVRLWIAMQFHAQSDHFFEWAAVLFACGVGVYFALRFEPSLLLLGISAGFAALLVFARLGVPSGAITL